MQATDFGNREDRAERRRLDMPPIGSIFLEREVSAGPVIVREIRREDSSKVTLAVAPRRDSATDSAGP